MGSFQSAVWFVSEFGSSSRNNTNLISFTNPVPEMSLLKVGKLISQYSMRTNKRLYVVVSVSLDLR